MQLSDKLRTAREAASLSQEQAARGLGVPRELISMWEMSRRVPGLKQLEQLAFLYRAPYLVNDNETVDALEQERNTFFAELKGDDESVQSEVAGWLQFLDRWAQFQKLRGIVMPGRGKPPKNIDKGSVFKDSRYAAKAALEVRQEYKLGSEALPDLLTFLDEQQILIYKANLGRWSNSANEGISGAFYNHPELGYCVIVNAETTPGRQAFTMAHELGHALYHYSLRSVVSRNANRDQVECFADAFASHLLVPTKALNSVIDLQGWKTKLDAYKTIWLAGYFRVSYAFLLYRLFAEKHISDIERQSWSKLSPSKLAEVIGIDARLFRSDHDQIDGIHRYPASVITQVRDAVSREEVDVEQAASVLLVDPIELNTRLFEQPDADEDETREALELAHLGA